MDYGNALFNALFLEETLVAREFPGTLIDIAGKPEVLCQNAYPVKIELADAREDGVNALLAALLFQEVNICSADVPAGICRLFDRRAF